MKKQSLCQHGNPQMQAEAGRGHVRRTHYSAFRPKGFFYFDRVKPTRFLEKLQRDFWKGNLRTPPRRFLMLARRLL